MTGSVYVPQETAEADPALACRIILGAMRAAADPVNVNGMARFGISTVGTLGISVTSVRAIAKPLLRARGTQSEWRHDLAVGLWDSGVHEARILATLLEDPATLTREQALEWAAASDSWDITDGLCLNLLDKTGFAYELAEELAARDETFVKRAGFALIAGLAWHDKDGPHERFIRFLDIIESNASDSRNFVTKSVDWALRQVGKRDPSLHQCALQLARRLADSPDRVSRRVGRVSARELESEKVRLRLGI